MNVERPILYAEVPPGGRLIGRGGPIAVEALSETGHWVATCHPSTSETGAPLTDRGDLELETLLLFHLGQSSEPIDAILRTDDVGRHVVIAVRGEPFLVDAVTGDRESLAPLLPDLRPDALADHRSFVFAGGGLALLQADQKGGRQTGVFIPLSTTGSLNEALLAKVAIDFGSLPVWRLSGGESHLSATTLPQGADETTWPVPASPANKRRCGGPSQSYVVYERLTSVKPDARLSSAHVAISPDKKLPSLITLDEAPGFVMGFGADWVRREESGRLVLVQGKTQKQIASARCGARVLQADPKSGLFLIACEEFTLKAPPKSEKRKAPKYRFELYLIRPGFVRSLDAELSRTGVDVSGPTDGSLAVVRPGPEASLVDFARRTITPLAGELQVLSTSRNSALLRRGRTLTLWTPSGEKKLDLDVPSLAPILIEGPAASVDRTVFLLEPELTSWSLPAAPLALTSRGYALVPRRAPVPGHLAEGPLLLLAPRGGAHDGDSPEQPSK